MKKHILIISTLFISTLLGQGILDVTDYGAVEVRISSGDPTHPTFGAPPCLYVICHSHTKQIDL
ncbi:MAG TPA: hypothetical protein EYN29_05005 [Candidatus Marinimicrobia bacterium]|nr:hypothetical protein [Candidatus Neomarinimicrobiota bacterium]